MIVAPFSRAADQAHAGAQFNLGFMYATGLGVSQDYAEAAPRRAARALLQGYVLAHMWFNLAAS